MLQRLLAASLLALAWNGGTTAAAEPSLFADSATDEPVTATSLRLHTPHLHRHVPAFDAAAPNCTIGVDLATPSSVSAFECMAQNGIQQATIRAYQSNCWLDPHAPDTIRNAWAAGLSVDIYIFPSVGCDLDPIAQIDVTLDHLAENNATFNTLWIDVEDWAWAPIAECQQNLDWVAPMMQRAIDRVGIERVGVYSMATMWNRIMCNTSLYANTQLWWAHWSGGQSFADYQEFGGWTLPLAKQYADSGPGCYVDVDMDWRGTGSCGFGESSLQRKRDLEKQMEADAAAMALARESSADGASPLNCTIGVDLATPVSVSAFQCLIATRGVQFLVVRAYQSNCLIDPHTVATIQAAWAAGIQGVDVYFFPSVGCSMEPVLQFEATMDHLRRNGVANFSTMWFDVETWQWAPPADCAQNVEWFLPLYNHAVQVLGVERVGIYTLKSMWDDITCADSTNFTSAKLWDARWDHNPSFANFTAFGSWTEPDTKQFTGNDFACDIHLDFDYRASGVC